MKASEKSDKHRYKQLDGLRGIAAIIVVFFHASLVMGNLIPQSVWYFLNTTPLGFFVSGREMVSIFFVMSGFVLTIPVMKSFSAYSWPKYYSSRILRLYIPSAAAIIYSAFLLTIITNPIRLQKPPGFTNQVYLAERSNNVHDPVTVLMELFSFPYQTASLDDALWSIKWELLFSILLPLFVWITVKLRKQPYVLILLYILGIWVGGGLNQSIENIAFVLSTFGIGVLFAVHRERIALLIKSYLVKKEFTVAVSAVILLLVSYFIRLWSQVQPGVPDFIAGAYFLLLIVGASVIVLFALYIPWFQNFLQKKPILFLGKISFSLYLIHIPLLIALGKVIPANLIYLLPLLGIPTALIVAALFQKFIEGPSHNFAKFVGKKVDATYRDIKANGITLR